MMWWMLLGCSCSEPAVEAEPESPALAPVVAEPREDVLLIVIDTLRADALRSARTPHLDTLEQRVERAWSSGTWTVPRVFTVRGFPGSCHRGRCLAQGQRPIRV